MTFAHLHATIVLSRGLAANLPKVSVKQSVSTIYWNISFTHTHTQTNQQNAYN